MGFNHIDPRELNEYVQQRLAEHPNLQIGIIRQSAEGLANSRGLINSIFQPVNNIRWNSRLAGRHHQA